MVRHGNRFRNSWWSAEFVYLRTAICCQSMSILYPISKHLWCFWWWSKSKWLQIFWINVTVSFPTKHSGPKKDVFVRNVIVATGGQAPFCHTNNEIMIIWSWLDIEHYCILLVFFVLSIVQGFEPKTPSHMQQKVIISGSFDWVGAYPGKPYFQWTNSSPTKLDEAGSCTFAKKLAEATPRRGFKSPETRGAKIMFTTLAINGESPKQAMRSNRYQFL